MWKECLDGMNVKDGLIMKGWWRGCTGIRWEEAKDEKAAWAGRVEWCGWEGCQYGEIYGAEQGYMYVRYGDTAFWL